MGSNNEKMEVKNLVTHSFQGTTRTRRPTHPPSLGVEEGKEAVFCWRLNEVAGGEYKSGLQITDIHVTSCFEIARLNSFSPPESWAFCTAISPSEGQDFLLCTLFRRQKAQPSTV